VSRIILAEFPGTSEHHLVVGWDHPVASYFWQEFNQEPEVFEREDGTWGVRCGAIVKETEFKTKAEAGEEKWDLFPSWEEMKGYGGYGLNELPTILTLLDAAPPKIKVLLTEDVQRVLNEHSMDPESGRLPPVRMIPTSYKVEVQTFGETKWSTNAIRFATQDEADKAGVDLAHRWTMLENWRVAPSDDPVNYKWEDGKAVSV
jgi:hypothetical protein